MPGNTGTGNPESTRVTRAALVALGVLGIAVFVAALDQTMVLTVMPSIMRSLYIDVRNLSDAGWIITGYLLGYTVAMPLFGRLADVWGRRPTYILALVLFMVGSALCVLLSRLDLFVAARVIQAAGGGALVPIAMAASADMFPLRRRGLVLGVIGGAAEAGGVLGPIYGASLAALWDWRLIFLVNVPLCVVLIAASWRLLRPSDRAAACATEAAEPETELPGGSGALAARRSAWNLRTRVDWVGAALMALALAGITIGLGTGTQSVDTAGPDQAAMFRWPWLVVGVVAFAIFVLFERHQQHPLIRLDFFRRVGFAAANTANFLVGAALIIGMVEIPLYAYTLFGLSEIEGGLLLIRLTLMIPVGAVIGGWLGDWVGNRITAVLGFILAAVGFVLVSRWPLDPSGWLMTRDLIISGFGFGLVIAPVSASVIASVGPHWMATGSALVTVSRMVGMVVGLSALSSWGVQRYNALAAHIEIPIIRPEGLNDAEWQALKTAATNATRDALHTVFSEFFLIAAVIAALAIIPALFLHRRVAARSQGRMSFMPH